MIRIVFFTMILSTVLLSGCIHLIVPTIMSEAKRQHDLSVINKKLCQLKERFCQP